MCKSSHLAQAACLLKTEGEKLHLTITDVVSCLWQWEREGQRQAEEIILEILQMKLHLDKSDQHPEGPIFSHSVLHHDIIA